MNNSASSIRPAASQHSIGAFIATFAFTVIGTMGIAATAAVIGFAVDSYSNPTGFSPELEGLIFGFFIGIAIGALSTLALSVWDKELSGWASLAGIVSIVLIPPAISAVDSLANAIAVMSY